MKNFHNYIDDKFSPKTGEFDLIKIEKQKQIRLIMRKEETSLYVAKDYPMEDFRALYSMLLKIKDIPNLYFSMHQTVTQIPGSWICTELKQETLHKKI